jgi:ATP-dependent DNA helicase RecQ
VLLSGAEDDEIADYFVRTAFPTAGEVQQVLDALRQARAPLKRAALQQRVNIAKGKLDKVLKFLELESPSPIQETPDGLARNPVSWAMPVERIARITNLRMREQQRMREYISTSGCLMQFLSEELSDPGATRCGKCANCRGRGFEAGFPPQLAEAAATFLNNVDLLVEPRKMWPSGITFEGMHGRLQPEVQAGVGRALCRWGDPGLGELVRSGKQQTQRFSDRLVGAAVRFIRERWNPQPVPQWITCVPSRRRVSLVPDFAARLASALGLPFVQCIRKVRETEPQKTRQNSFQQVLNLEGAFEVDPRMVQDTPVLLVDDMVDSRWTFTVLAAKLLQAGSGPVWPFALADSSSEDGG